MIFDKFLLLFFIKCISTEDHRNFIMNVTARYNGKDFPEKYLVPEDVTPTVSDLNHYLVTIRRTVNYFAQNPNDTDVNGALGIFSMNSILKRSLKDYAGKIPKKQQKVILSLLKKGDYILSHYLYFSRVLKGGYDLQFRLTRLFVDDSPMVHTMSEFNRYIIKEWLHKKINMHEYIQEMDTCTLSKEKYTNLVVLDHDHSMLDHYNIKIDDSDLCLSRILLNPEPTNIGAMRPCRKDKFCLKRIYQGPSIAYHLSHRLLNNLLYNAVRRCYLRTEEADREHMNMLCSFMYREAVYMARRGYFFRDLFMEHIALCGFLGYEEFYRRHWFYKAASWIDDNGCMTEFRNFEINATEILAKTNYQDKPEEEKKFRKKRRQLLLRKDCDLHQMAVFLIMLSHGIRHALHFMPTL